MKRNINPHSSLVTPKYFVGVLISTLAASVAYSQGRMFSQDEETVVTQHIDDLRSTNKLFEAKRYCQDRADRFGASSKFRIRQLDVLFRLGDFQAGAQVARAMKVRGQMPPLARYMLRSELSNLQEASLLREFYDKSLLRNLDGLEAFPYSELHSREDRDWCWLIYIGYSENNSMERWIAEYYLGLACSQRPGNPLSSYLLGSLKYRENRVLDALPLFRVAYANGTGGLRESAGAMLRLITKNREGRVP